MEAFLCLKLEFMKFRKSFLKFIFIFPAALYIAGLSIGLYFKRESFLTYGNLKDGFSGLLLANHLMLFWPFILLLCVISVSIYLFYIETANNSLTAVCSCKLKRSSIYLGKWMFLILSAFLLILIGDLTLAVTAKLFNIPMKENGLLFKYTCFELLCSFGLISFQMFLTSLFKSIETSAVISLIAAVVFNAIGAGKDLVPYIPYLCFTNSTPFSNTIILRKTILVSFIYFIVFLVLGIINFKFRDIRE